MPGDVDDLHKLHSDPLTMRFVGPGRPETREECDHRLASYLNEQRTRGWTKWRVQTPKGSMIGRAGFGAYGPNRELGYTLRSDSWGHGVATELALALARLHTENPDPNGPSDLWAYAAVEHLPSRQGSAEGRFRTVSTTRITMALRVRSTFSHMGRDSDEHADLA